jgi:chemotaxis protein methyltransferase CheR
MTVDPICKMSAAEFGKISTFIFTEYGIKLPPIKKTMVESRLQKRLRELNVHSFKSYFEYVFSPAGQQQELIKMVDVITTNKTDFFREADHFDFISHNVLPQWLNKFQPRQMKIWSAGCSSGEEPYTISMVMSEFQEANPSFDFSILGTDLSTEVLNKAVTAVYTEDKISSLPIITKKKYFLRSKDTINKTVRILPGLRKKITFQRLNFMDEKYNVPDSFDIIFCRNVLIYFSKETQENVINKLVSKLKKGGYFFLGHSESVTHMDVPLKQIKPTVFVKI